MVTGKNVGFYLSHLWLGSGIQLLHQQVQPLGGLSGGLVQPRVQGFCRGVHGLLDLLLTPSRPMKTDWAVILMILFVSLQNTIFRLLVVETDGFEVATAAAFSGFFGPLGICFCPTSASC